MMRPSVSDLAPLRSPTTSANVRCFSILPGSLRAYSSAMFLKQSLVFFDYFTVFTDHVLVNNDQSVFNCRWWL